ncbi:hypothetical protein D3C78_1289460 [compost metagenome]
MIDQAEAIATGGICLQAATGTTTVAGSLTGQTVDKVLSNGFVETTHHSPGQLSCEHVAIIDVREQGILLIGRIGVGEIITQFEAGIFPQRDTGIAQIEDVGVEGGGIITRIIGVPRVIAYNGHGEFARTCLDVFYTGTGTRDIPIVEVGQVDIMTLIETLTSPEGFAATEQVLGLYVELTQCEVGIAVVSFPVTLLTRGHGKHGVYIESLVVFAEYFLTQLDFAVGFIFVTQTANTLFAQCLHVAVVGNTNT